MEKDKYARIQLRPHCAGHIDLVKEFLHPSYDLKSHESAKAGETGLLRLFSLKSKDVVLPDFDARWDIKENAVDIDLLGSRNISELFMGQTGGYRGHHSKELGDHRYHIDIAIPEHEIFRGILELDATGIVYLRDQVKLDIADTLKIYYSDTGKEIKID